MLFNKIKQNLAGFAAVAIAFTGLTATGPAFAVNYAANPGSMGDPAASASWTQAFSTNSSTMVTTITVPAGQSLNRFSSSTVLTSADSVALRGKVISWTYTLVNTATSESITSGGTNPGIRVNNAWTSFPFPPAARVLTWPNSTGSSDELSMNVNYGSQVPAGTYEFTLKWFADGQQITTAPGNAIVGFQFASGISGTTPALSSFERFTSGYVCVNPSLVSSGDVLTSRPVINGTVVPWNSSSVYWSAGGSSIGSLDSITLTGTHISAGQIAVKGYFGNSSSVTAGQPFTAEVSITKANGTEVTYPCPTPTVGSVAISSATTSQVVGAVTGSADVCRLDMQMGQNYVMASIRPIVNGVCTMTPMGGPSFSDGTYRLSLSASGLWSSSPVMSTNNPTFTISAGQVAQNSNQQSQNSNSPSVSVVPTNVPLIRPNLALSQTVRAGGALVIEADNAASVSEVKIGGVDAKLEVVNKGVEVVVPTGLTPGAKDLFIKTATGSTLHVGAIKIADPIVEAAKLAYAKAASSVAFRAPIDQAVAGARPTSAQVAEARAHSAEYKTAKEAICVAIPASKATAASARAAATALCSAMKSVNRKLKVTVVVEAPSGNKTNVVSSELIG